VIATRPGRRVLPMRQARRRDGRRTGCRRGRTR
jgi:hypothetical protein